MKIKYKKMLASMNLWAKTPIKIEDHKLSNIRSKRFSLEFEVESPHELWSMFHYPPKKATPLGPFYARTKNELVKEVYKHFLVVKNSFFWYHPRWEDNLWPKFSCRSRIPYGIPDYYRYAPHGDLFRKVPLPERLAHYEYRFWLPDTLYRRRVKSKDRYKILFDPYLEYTTDDEGKTHLEYKKGKTKGSKRLELGGPDYDYAWAQRRLLENKILKQELEEWRMLNDIENKNNNWG